MQSVPGVKIGGIRRDFSALGYARELTVVCDGNTSQIARPGL